jgi:hypothetical protein
VNAADVSGFAFPHVQACTPIHPLRPIGYLLYVPSH